MSSIKTISIKKNFIMNMILTVLGVVFPLISFPYVSRVLFPENMGKVSFATSFVFYFTSLAQLGIPTYGIRICAELRDDKQKLTRTVHELLIIQVIMTVISYALLFIIIFNVPSLEIERRLYMVVGIKILFEAIGMEWLYKGLEQYSYITKRSLLCKFISLILIFLFIRNKNDYIIYGFLLIFADTASNILNIFNVHKFIQIKWLGHYSLKKHLKSIIIFFSMVCATTIYTHLDTVMLGFMTNDANVGYYNVAIKIKTVLVSFITALGVVLLPRLSYYVKTNQISEFKKLTQRAMHFILLFSIPLMVYFIIFSKTAVHFLAGVQYDGAILPLQVLMPTLLIIGITNILGIQVLVPLGREKIVLYSQIAGAITDILLNYILIPKYAVLGAALGTLFAELAVLIVQAIALIDILPNFFKNIKYYKLILAVFVASIIVIKIPFSSNYNIIILCLTAMVYFFIYGICLIILREDFIIDILKRIVLKLRNREEKDES